ncbi:ROK family protein (putative glucokinase) [Paenisporosarcina quisquiliarum]|nr:ROK family protein (putative glucokinase) [Paenisporosarcina quisquiliarum]
MKILAIDIGGTSIKFCISDENGNIFNFKEYDSEAKKGAKHLIARIIQLIKMNYKDFQAIGISTAGQVNNEEGSIIYANDNIPNYTGMKVKDIFEMNFKVPVVVENDVNAAALGERNFGAGKKYKNFLCLTYGTGIGGAIVCNSGIYRGFNGSASEFGHMILYPGGRKCTCGFLGCYEMYGSTTILVKKALEVDKKYVSGRDIFEGLERGNTELEKILEGWVSDVVYGLVSLTHIFNPPAIILGGGVMEQDKLVTLINSKVKELIIESYSDIEIVKASLGNKAGLLGAVSLISGILR